MIYATLPLAEQTRIASLIGLRVLDTPAEDRYDRVTRLAARVFGVPIALVNFVDQDRVWCKSTFGLEVDEVRRDASFCAHAILERDVMTVPDARKDVAHVVENELAVSRLGETQSRLIAERDELRRKAMIDPETRLWNRGAILEILGREVKRIRRQRGTVSVAVAQVDRFERFEGAGDRAGAALRWVARQMRCWTRPYDAIGRYGRDAFLLVLPACEAQVAAGKLDIVRRVTASGTSDETAAHAAAVTFSAGVADGRGMPVAILRNAILAMRRARRAGGNRIEIA